MSARSTFHQTHAVKLQAMVDAGRTNAEIAQKLGVSPKSVSRALSLLQIRRSAGQISQMKRAEWKLRSKQPLPGPMRSEAVTEIVDGVRITRCPPGYSHGYHPTKMFGDRS